MKKLFIILPILLVALACSTFPWSSSSSTTTAQPAVVTFTATPTSITAGETVTLMWNVTNATSVQIDQGVGSGLAAAGTVTVTPASTTTYQLTVSNSAGSVTSSITITVSSSSTSTPTTPVPLPILPVRPNIAIFDISPNTLNVPPGPGAHQATMRWEVHNAVSVYINGLPKPLSGSEILTPPLGTHTYTLRAVNPAGEDTKTQVIHVNP